MMATLNMLFVWNWQYYTIANKAKQYCLWSKKRTRISQASGSYILKCTS